MYNYYKILEIAQDASPDEIKKAYWKKPKLFHPDINKGHHTHELFILIKQAYEILIDRNKRRLFDGKLNYASSAHVSDNKQYYYKNLRINRAQAEQFPKRRILLTRQFWYF